MFGINGMNANVMALQFATGDILTQGIARAVADPSTASPTLIMRMAEFGIDFDALKAYSGVDMRSEDGINRFGSAHITDNPELARNLRDFIAFTVRRAASEPDLGAQVMVRGGLQDGTWMGGAMRALTMYSTF
ncbi:hypothetical protein RZS08_48485, partial [Arthrospira platensis SPKY1]|nr:hypothetical protein [Arthrospira platensis SPKY1]